MKIAIIGCGWVGKRLAKYLTERNHHVIATTTSPEKLPELKEIASEVQVLDFGGDYDDSFLEDVDFAVFSMPISRTDWHRGFQKLNIHFSKTLLFSSTGIYAQENRIYTEYDTGDLREDILAAENLVRTKYPQTTVLRFGGLMGGERALQNFFRTKQPPHAEKKVNYIHYEDILAIVELFLTVKPQNEVYNIVAPQHPTIGDILNIKTEDKACQPGESGDRIISPDLFIKEFNYTFIHPNPKYF